MNSLAAKKILVTGAGGFIGSHLAEALATAGAQVRAMVHYNALGKAGWLDRSSLRECFDVYSGDLRDRDSVCRAVEDREIVFHLGALVDIPYSYQAPASYVDTNVVGTLNVLMAARAAGVARIVHTSTSEVYGTAVEVPIAENHRLMGQSPYAASKIGADQLAQAFYLSYGVPVVTVRPFNAFGPRQSTRAVIPSIIMQCLTRDVVRLGHLHPTRDLNYVTDTVQGFLCAAVAPGVLGATFNIGSGREISIGDLAELIIRLVGRSVRIERDDARARPATSEVERLVADASHARARISWAPRVGLEEGLLTTIDWFRKQAHECQSVT